MRSTVTFVRPVRCPTETCVANRTPHGAVGRLRQMEGSNGARQRPAVDPSIHGPCETADSNSGNAVLVGRPGPGCGRRRGRRIRRHRRLGRGTPDVRLGPHVRPVDRSARTRPDPVGRRCVHADRPGRVAGGRPFGITLADFLARRGGRVRAGAGDRRAARPPSPSPRPGTEPEHQRNDVEITAEQAAAHPIGPRRGSAGGVLRGLAGGACLLRVRGKDDATPLRGADLAPNLLAVLQATFED